MLAHKESNGKIWGAVQDISIRFFCIQGVHVYVSEDNKGGYIDHFNKNNPLQHSPILKACGDLTFYTNCFII